MKHEPECELSGLCDGAPHSGCSRTGSEHCIHCQRWCNCDKVRAAYERGRTDRPCNCDRNPETTDGPSEDCPSHGNYRVLDYIAGEKAATDRAAGPHSTPEGHAAAIADTHTSHVLKGFGYLIQCEWCPETFFAPTKREAMERFRAHEQRMFDLADAIRAAGPDKGRET